MAAIEHTGHAVSQGHTLCAACQEEWIEERDAVLAEADSILIAAGVDPRKQLDLYMALKTRILRLADR